MAQRTVALYNGTHIGIETIFTVIDGKQVNIPKKVEALRALSRSNELFCPCGCGANLILVAGDRNLREQHFRIKEGSENHECHFVAEGLYSIYSKIALKCWFDEKTGAEDIRSRVQIKDVDDENRKFEFTFLSEQKKTAVSYCRERSNLSDEKIKILDANSKDIKIIYIVDSENRGTNGQYPEGLMKVQSRQGYCLFLSVTEEGYPKAELDVAFYHEDVDGFWVEEAVISGLLKDYGIDDAGEPTYRGQKVWNIVENLKPVWREHYRAERKRKKEEAERQRQIEIERQKRLEQLKEQQRLTEQRLRKQNEEQQRLKEQMLRKQIEEQQRLKELRLKTQKEEGQKRKAQKAAEEAARKKAALEFEALMTDMKSDHPQQEKEVMDEEGRRWFKCEYCGKIAMGSEFSYTGGAGKRNLGTCRECVRNNPDAQEEIYVPSKNLQRRKDSKRCPRCGGRLVERYGRYGSYLACEDRFCNYTRSK